jgi:putative peptidoglycan binding protein
MKISRLLFSAAALAASFLVSPAAHAHHWHGGSVVVVSGCPRVGFGFGFGAYPCYYGGYPYGGYPYCSAPYPYYYDSYSYYAPPREYVYVPAHVYAPLQHGHSLAADVQRVLAREGYYRGPIDGDIGPASRAAIREYQREHGLRVTGGINDSLVRSLHV